MLPNNGLGNRPPISAWQTEILRLTAFPSPTPEIADHNWWASVVGQAPDTTVVRAKQGDFRAEGPLGAGNLTLRIQPARIEWLFRPSDKQIQATEGLPLIGSFPETLETFLPLMLRWLTLDTCPLVERLAFGAVLWQPVEDKPTGYRQIINYLPQLQLEPENVSDLLYQINRPRLSQSGIENLQINRLSKWSVNAVQTIDLLGQALGPYYSPGPEYVAIRSELDINTSLDFQGELAREQLVQIFQELVDLGREVAEQGDIA